MKIQITISPIHQTYFAFTVKINHVHMISEEGIYRNGTEFVDDTVNKKALYHFVKFIENVSASLKSDNGDVMVSNIK